MNTVLRSSLAALLCMATSGCLSSNPPVPVRHFAPPVPTPERGAGEVALTEPRVTGPAFLDERMVWRRSDVEVAVDDVHRWTARPADLVQEALRATLFDAGRFRPTTDRAAAWLEARLLAFEGGLGGASRARVALAVRLGRPDGGPVTARIFEADAPLAGTTPEELARAMGKAMRALLDDVAEWCRVELAAGR